MSISNLNLNKASVHELQEFFGIGVQSAKRMVRYREENNNKLSRADIALIPNLSNATVKKVAQKSSKQNINKAASKFNPSASFKGNRFKVLLPNEEKNKESALEIGFKADGLFDKKGIPLNDLKLKRNAEGNNMLRINVPLSKHTPPGTYKVLINAGSKQFEVNLDVVENMGVTIFPNSIQLLGNQRTAKKELMITNTGNVPLEIKDPGAIMLEVEHIDCRVIRGVVGGIRSNRSKASANIDEIINLASKELEQLYHEAGALKVTLVGGATVIAPGESKKVTLNFSIPTTLKNRSYNGTIRFYETNLHVNVSNS